MPDSQTSLTAQEALAVHKLILEGLLRLSEGPNAVLAEIWLVARLNSPEFTEHATDGVVRFFVPDMHLLTYRAEALYNFTFRKKSSGALVPRDVILERVLQEVGELARPANGVPPFEVYQLGDYADLWREGDEGKTGSKDDWDRIAKDNVLVEHAFANLQQAGVRTRFVAGNHDKALVQIEPGRFKRHYLAGNDNGFLITHGDSLDWIEDNPDSAKSFLSRAFGKGFDASNYPLNRTIDGASAVSRSVGGPPTKIQSPNSIADNESFRNVWLTEFGDDETVPYPVQEWERGHRLMKRAYFASLLMRGRSVVDDDYRKVRDSIGEGEIKPRNLAAIFIGHSHQARICVHDRWYNGANARERYALALVDCGAWFENCRLLKHSGKGMPSCQIGVQCGNDIRIYQLTPKEAL